MSEFVRKLVNLTSQNLRDLERIRKRESLHSLNEALRLAIDHTAHQRQSRASEGGTLPSPDALPITVATPIAYPVVLPKPKKEEKLPWL